MLLKERAANVINCSSIRIWELLYVTLTSLICMQGYLCYLQVIFKDICRYSKSQHVSTTPSNGNHCKPLPSSRSWSKAPQQLSGFQPWKVLNYVESPWSKGQKTLGNKLNNFKKRQGVFNLVNFCSCLISNIYTKYTKYEFPTLAAQRSGPQFLDVDRSPKTLRKPDHLWVFGTCLALVWHSKNLKDRCLMLRFLNESLQIGTLRKLPVKKHMFP